MNNMIKPDWPAPSHIKAYTTLREGGVSQAPYHSFNLADHVGDHPQHVKKNRALLKKILALPNEPIWLEQIHSTIALPAIAKNRGKQADATFTTLPQQVCAVLTADCLPILLCNQQGTYVAAIHAGWRGLLHGIIEKTLNAIQLPHEEILAWLGPAIGPNQYEVGSEIRDLFLSAYPQAEHAFTPSPQQGWLANLYALAQSSLQAQKISLIYGATYCTYSEPEFFFSYRRDQTQTGRMASLIWIDQSE